MRFSRMCSILMRKPARQRRICVVFTICVCLYIVVVGYLQWDFGKDDSGNPLSRGRNLHDVCSRYDVKGKSWFYLNNTEHQLYYCVVPKAGCTYWKQIFRFVNKDTWPHRVRAPSELPRAFVHRDSPKTHKATVDILQHQKANSFRFLFARDPYSRLWSAYLDKFYLPGFWSAYRISGENTKDSTCLRTFSFSQFLKMVLTQSDGMVNQHWRPINDLCDPCSFNPHAVGKMETFQSDANFILRKVGLQHLVEKEDSHAAMYINDLIETFFDKRRHLPTECLGKKALAGRLWKVLQFHGFIPAVTSFPADHIVDISRDQVILLALETYRDSGYRPKEMREQRRQALVNAYRGVPENIINKIQYMYREDFLLFSYDSTPPHKRFISQAAGI